MNAQKSLKVLFSLVVALVVTVVGLQFSATPAYAGWEIPIPLPGGDEICVGFGCPGGPIIGSDRVKDIWEEIGMAPQSVASICQEVGLTMCTDPAFIYTFQILHAGQWAGMYYDVDGCAATGFSLNDGGHKAAQIIALYYGVAVPTEILNFSQGMYDSHIIAACQYLFDDAFNVNNVEYVEDGVYAKPEDVDGIRSQIRGGQAGEVPATSPTSSGATSNDAPPATIQVRFENKTSSDVYFFLNGGTGLETKLAPGELQSYTMVVDPGVQPIVGIHQPNGQRLDFTVSNNGSYAFIIQNGKIVNAYN